MTLSLPRAFYTSVQPRAARDQSSNSRSMTAMIIAPIRAIVSHSVSVGCITPFYRPLAAENQERSHLRAFRTEGCS